MLNRRTNEQWLTELRGDEGAVAQEQAYIDLGRYILVVAYKILQSNQPEATPSEVHEYAIDMTQSVLEKMPQIIDNYRGESPFTIWAGKFTHRFAMSELRKPERRLGMLHYDSSIDGIESIAALIDPSITPETATLREERVQILAKGFEKLSERERTALWQSIVEDKSGQEIANNLGISRNELYRLTIAARKRLRDFLEEAGFS